MLKENIKFAIITAATSAFDTAILSTVLIGVGFIQRRTGDGTNKDLLKKSVIPLLEVFQIGFNVFTRKMADNYLIIEDCKDKTKYGFIQNNFFCIDKKSYATFLVKPLVGLVSGATTTKMILSPADNTVKAVDEFCSKVVANGLNSAIYDFHSAYEGYLTTKEPDLFIQKHNATRLFAAAIVAETVDSSIKRHHPGGVIDGMAVAVGFLSKDYVVDLCYGIEPPKKSTENKSDQVKQPDYIDSFVDKMLEYGNSLADSAQSLYQNIVNYTVDQVATSGDNIKQNAEL